MSTDQSNDHARYEGFISGYVVARDPKTPRDTLLALEEAERAWLNFIATRNAG